MAKKCKYYVVWSGLEPGIYDNWDDCKEQVDAYPGARYKSYPSYEAAIRAFRGDDAREAKTLLELGRREARELNYSGIDGIDPRGIAVDGACSRNPGPMEYRGVVVGTGEQLFHVGPVDGGSNNIAEYLAIVHALALCAQRREPRRAIYSDSRIAQEWLRRRQAHPEILRTASNGKVFELLARADRWVQTHQLTNPVIKWDTAQWGEIPADFGRK